LRLIAFAVATARGRIEVAQPQAQSIVATPPVVIVGGGMAGSLLALVLGRAGLRVKLIDLKREPAPAFRNEKLGLDQIERLRRLGVLSCFQEACWGAAPLDGDTPPPGKPPLKDSGARYDRWIERIRAAWPAEVDFIEGKVNDVSTSPDVQAAVLSTGQRIEGRLLVMATGRGERLRNSLKVSRRVLSERHSICIGFSVAPPTQGEAPPAGIFAARFGSRHAYVTFFTMLDEIRINMFSYRELDDPWVAEVRKAPLESLKQDFPAAAAALAGLAIMRPPEIRSTDLYAVEGHVQPGVLLLGDAFHAPCPASGTGMTRILNDVERLADVYLPRWLATPGMDADKIAAFYKDPAKLAVDRSSLLASIMGRRSATDQSFYWRARCTVGKLRRSIANAFVETRFRLNGASGAATARARAGRGPAPLHGSAADA
jgi:2-polyprenyl-6-methoxyphenol hydroxylase-like FAD-dependent oxidoreductase